MFINKMAKKTKKVLISPDIFFHKIGREMLLVHMKNFKIFNLNPLATVIFEGILRNKDLKLIQKKIIHRFRIKPKQIRDDFKTVLGFFKKNGVFKTK